MCIICVDLDRGKLDPWEAARNRSEMLADIGEEHAKQLDEKIRHALVDYLNELSLRNLLEEGECSE